MALVALSNVWPENLSSLDDGPPLVLVPEEVPLVERDIEGVVEVGVAARAIL